MNKYKELGFITIGTQDNNKILMEITPNNAQKAVNKLKSSLDINPSKTNENINLTAKLDI